MRKFPAILSSLSVCFALLVSTAFATESTAANDRAKLAASRPENQSVSDFVHPLGKTVAAVEGAIDINAMRQGNLRSTDRYRVGSEWGKKPVDRNEMQRNMILRRTANGERRWR